MPIRRRHADNEKIDALHSGVRGEDEVKGRSDDDGSDVLISWPETVLRCGGALPRM